MKRSIFVLWIIGVHVHFQQYLNYIEMEEVPKKPTTMPQVTDKFYQIMLYRIGLTTGGSQPLNFGGERHWLIALLNVNITTMRSRPDGVLCRLDWVWYNYKAELLRLIQKRCSFTIICVQVWNWILSHVHLYPYSFFLFFYQKIQKCTKNSKQLVQVLYTMYMKV